MYFLDSSSVTGGNFLHLTLSPANDSLNVFSVTENIGSSSNILKYVAGSDEVSMSGFTTHSFIPIPDGYSIKLKSATQTDTVALPLQHIIALSSSLVIASNDSAGLFYSTNAGDNWKKSSSTPVKPTDPVILFAAVNGNAYAATYTGNLITSTNGSSWKFAEQFYPNRVLAIATDRSTGNLFVSMSNNVVYRLNQSSGKLDTIRSHSGQQFTSLAYLAIDSSRGQNVLVGGTANGLFYHLLSQFGIDSGWNLSKNITSGNVRSIVATDSVFFSTVGDRVNTSSDGVTWQSLPGIDTGMLVFDSGLNTISWTKHGQFNSLNGNSNILPLGKRIINDFTAFDGNYFAATDSGVYSVLYQTQNWAASSSGLGVIQLHGADIPGSIVLLHSVSGGISIDSSWQACTLINSLLNKEFPITARIIAHLDHVTMHDSTQYNDVIEVQYSFEQGTKPSPSIPYWQIYYAKGIGPIIIYEINNSVITTKIYRSKF